MTRSFVAIHVVNYALRRFALAEIRIRVNHAADWVINRLVENEIKTLPEDFLEYHQRQRSPYDGTFSEIFETKEYPSSTACGAAILASIKK